MQEIRVKEIKGPLGKGERKFYALKDEKGAEFTTFDAKVSKITPGSLISAEIKIEGKYNNITDWKLIEDAPVTSHNGNKLSPEQWAEKDRIERASIEAQTAFKGIMELAWKHETPNHISGKFGDAFDLALDWAMTRLTDQVKKPIDKPIRKEPEAEPLFPEDNLKDMDFKNQGEFYTACLKHFGLSKSKTDSEIASYDISVPAQRKLAWLSIIGVYKGKETAFGRG